MNVHCNSNNKLFDNESSQLLIIYVSSGKVTYLKQVFKKISIIQNAIATII